jgi:hypothetical protein
MRARLRLVGSTACAWEERSDDESARKFVDFVTRIFYKSASSKNVN